MFALDDNLVTKKERRQLLVGIHKNLAIPIPVLVSLIDSHWFHCQSHHHRQATYQRDYIHAN